MSNIFLTGLDKKLSAIFGRFTGIFAEILQQPEGVCSSGLNQGPTKVGRRAGPGIDSGLRTCAGMMSRSPGSRQSRIGRKEVSRKNSKA